jgi:thiamine pyrophosphokinase
MGAGEPPRARGLRVAVVFAGGDPPLPASVADIASADLVLAADSGLEHALALGIPVDVIVGDFDSAHPDAIDAAVAKGARLDRHDRAKDATDLELALAAARDGGATDVLVIGGDGGRLDHFLANALLLASPALADVNVSARLGTADVFVVRERVTMHAELGDLCTLLPVAGPATGVRTEGLLYPLHGETLVPGSTRGVSNEFVDTSARVELESGVLLVILPHARKHG